MNNQEISSKKNENSLLEEKWYKTLMETIKNFLLYTIFVTDKTEIFDFPDKSFVLVLNNKRVFYFYLIVDEFCDYVGDEYLPIGRFNVDLVAYHMTPGEKWDMILAPLRKCMNKINIYEVIRLEFLDFDFHQKNEDFYDKRQYIINNGFEIEKYERYYKKKITAVLFKIEVNNYVEYYFRHTSKKNIGVFARQIIRNDILNRLVETFPDYDDDYLIDCVTYYGETLELYDVDYEIKQYETDVISKAKNGFITHFTKIDESYDNPIWKTEHNLYLLVMKMYPKYTVYYQYLVPDSNQRYDIYIKDLKIAIEYQGKQHYEAIEIFGGREGLEKNKERDAKKKRISIINGIYIVYLKYDELINETKIRRKINYQLKNRQINHERLLNKALEEKRIIEQCEIELKLEQARIEKKKEIAEQKEKRISNIQLATELSNNSDFLEMYRIDSSCSTYEDIYQLFGKDKDLLNHYVKKEKKGNCYYLFYDKPFDFWNVMLIYNNCNYRKITNRSWGKHIYLYINQLRKSYEESGHRIDTLRVFTWLKPNVNFIQLKEEDQAFIESLEINNKYKEDLNRILTYNRHKDKINNNDADKKHE